MRLSFESVGEFVGHHRSGDEKRRAYTRQLLRERLVRQLTNSRNKRCPGFGCRWGLGKPVKAASALPSIAAVRAAERLRRVCAACALGMIFAVSVDNSWLRHKGVAERSSLENIVQGPLD